MPLNKIAYDDWMRDIRSATKNGSLEFMDGSIVQVTENDLQELESLIARVGTFIINDDKLLSMIVEEARAYFSGHKSAEDVAKLIQNRVTIYINE